MQEESLHRQLDSVYFDAIVVVGSGQLHQADLVAVALQVHFHFHLMSTSQQQRRTNHRGHKATGGSEVAVKSAVGFDNVGARDDRLSLDAVGGYIHCFVLIAACVPFQLTVSA